MSESTRMRAGGVCFITSASFAPTYCRGSLRAVSSRSEVAALLIRRRLLAVQGRAVAAARRFFSSAARLRFPVRRLAEMVLDRS